MVGPVGKGGAPIRLSNHQRAQIQEGVEILFVATICWYLPWENKVSDSEPVPWRVVEKPIISPFIIHEHHDYQRQPEMKK